MEKRVNIDYITAIRRTKDGVQVEQVEIQKNQALINDLKTLANNPNTTVMDLQSMMNRFFPEIDRNKMTRHAYPYSDYNILPVKYPISRTQEKYDKELKAVAEQHDDNQSEDYRRAKVNNYAIQVKMGYLRESLRYIDMFYYLKTAHLLRSDCSVLMMSHEICGWHSIEATLNKDLTVKIYTNFGFGQSSFFTTTLSYKGVAILTYSDIINYYFADIRDIISYTRRYSEERENWNVVAAFIAEAVNKSEKDVDGFVRTWLMNEVSSMVRGLEKIIENPQIYISNMSRRMNPERGLRYLTVRQMSEHEKKLYAVYPRELSSAFLAEKLSNCVKMLSKLQEAIGIEGQITDYIHRIKSIALKTIPRIKKDLADIQLDIAPLELRKSTLIEKRAEYDERLKEPLDEIQSMVTKELPWHKAEEQYIANHPQYALDKESRSKII